MLEYQVRWTDKEDDKENTLSFGSSLDAAMREANTQSAKHCTAYILAMEGDKIVGSLSYDFGRRGDSDGEMD